MCEVGCKQADSSRLLVCCAGCLTRVAPPAAARSRLISSSSSARASWATLPSEKGVRVSEAMLGALEAAAFERYGRLAGFCDFLHNLWCCRPRLMVIQGCWRAVMRGHPLPPAAAAWKQVCI